jgi:hypothetical protein
MSSNCLGASRGVLRFAWRCAPPRRALGGETAPGVGVALDFYVADPAARNVLRLRHCVEPPCRYLPTVSELHVGEAPSR